MGVTAGSATLQTAAAPGVSTSIWLVNRNIGISPAELSGVHVHRMVEPTSGPAYTPIDRGGHVTLCFIDDTVHRLGFSG